MPQRYLHLKWLSIVRIFKRLARSRGSSHSIALGVSLGLFLGMLPIMGVQMVLAAFIATLIKANRLAAIVPVWISNPATFIPLYGFNYWIGKVLTGWGGSFDEYERVLKESAQIAKSSCFIDGVIDGTKNFASLGPGALASLLIGSTIVGLVTALAAYPLTLRLVNMVRIHREKRRAHRDIRVQKILSERQFARGKGSDNNISDE